MDSIIDSKVTAGRGYVIVSRRQPLIGNEDLREIDGKTLPETNILLMDKILHHLGWLKPYK